MSNPGVILRHGEVCGIWTQRKKGSVMDIAVSLRRHLPFKPLEELLQATRCFREHASEP